MPLWFSSAAQDRKTYPNNSPSEPSYDSGSDDDDGDDDDDLANTAEDDSTIEESEDQLDQDDPGNFRDSIYDSFQKRDCMQYIVFRVSVLYDIMCRYIQRTYGYRCSVPNSK